MAFLRRRRVVGRRVVRRRLVRRPFVRRRVIRRVVRRSYRPRVSYREYLGLGMFPRRHRAFAVGPHRDMQHPADPFSYFGEIPWRSHERFAPSSMMPPLPSASSRAVKRPAAGGGAAL